LKFPVSKEKFENQKNYIFRVIWNFTI